MLPKILSFVDVETTGMSSQYGKIIEIGIIRVENNKVVDKFSTLINPQTIVDPFIQTMTGITSAQLEDAPTFYDISDKIKELLSDSLFVAHNVLFDYSFIKKEFERLEKNFVSKYCCSVKLSKNLYPKFKHHNLDSIIERFNFECRNRHRAFDDAKVVWDFYQHSLKKFGQEKLVNAFDRALKRPSLPVNITEDVLESLADTNGVYIFYNKDNVPLYIGKSKNLRTRVLSHFASSKKINLDMKISQNISRVETIETAGELGALLLEATLVKKLQPLLNKQPRYDEVFYKTKIKQWPFKGPIGIKEKSQKEEVFIVDKWCVLGSLKDESQSLEDISRDYLFDTDTYKILNRYINKTRNFEIFNMF